MQNGSTDIPDAVPQYPSLAKCSMCRVTCMNGPTAGRIYAQRAREMCHQSRLDAHMPQHVCEMAGYMHKLLNRSIRCQAICTNSSTDTPDTRLYPQITKEIHHITGYTHKWCTNTSHAKGTHTNQVNR